MYFYILQLFNVDYREDILLAMTSAGIKQATVVEGTNLDKIVAQEFPLFTGLFHSPADRERFSNLIFGMVDSEQEIDSLVEVLRQAGIDNRKEEIYRVVLLEGQRKA